MKLKSAPGAIVAVLLTCGGCLPAMAAEDPQSLDEVQVQGERLSSLRKAVTARQDEFIALYNKLNGDKRQEVSCREEATTGSRLAKRRCSTRGQDEARREEAIALMNNVLENASLQGAAKAQRAELLAAGVNEKGQPLSAADRIRLMDDSTLPAVPNHGDGVDAKLATEKNSLDENLQRLLAKYPELRQAQDKFLEARQRYEAARRR